MSEPLYRVGDRTTWRASWETSAYVVNKGGHVSSDKIVPGDEVCFPNGGMFRVESSTKHFGYFDIVMEWLGNLPLRPVGQ